MCQLASPCEASRYPSYNIINPANLIRHIDDLD